MQGISWQQVTITGRAAHAGTTPTALRADAGIPAARIVLRLREMVDSGEYGELRATVGHLAVHPDLTNIVPARAELTVDLRNPDDEQMARAEADLADYLAGLEGSPADRRAHQADGQDRHVPFDDRSRR